LLDAALDRLLSSGAVRRIASPVVSARHTCHRRCCPAADC
jgi:hypothetical protein